MIAALLLLLLLGVVDATLTDTFGLNQTCCDWHQLKFSPGELQNTSALEEQYARFVASEKEILNAKEVQYCLCDYGFEYGLPTLYDLNENSADYQRTKEVRN